MRCALLLVILAACEPEGFSVDRFSVEVDPLDETHPTITDMANGQLVTVDELASSLVAAQASSLAVIDEARTTAPVGAQNQPFVAAVDFGAFAVTFRGADVHPLTPCVLQPVRHVHLIFKRHKNDDDKLAWPKLHVGAYANQADYRTCYVIFDSQHPAICSNICGPRPPRFDELRDSLAVGIRKAVSGSQVVVSSALVLTAATVLARIAMFVL